MGVEGRHIPTSVREGVDGNTSTENFDLKVTIYGPRIKIDLVCKYSRTLQ